MASATIQLEVESSVEFFKGLRLYCIVGLCETDPQYKLYCWLLWNWRCSVSLLWKIGAAIFKDVRFKFGGCLQACCLTPCHLPLLALAATGTLMNRSTSSPTPKSGVCCCISVTSFTLKTQTSARHRGASCGWRQQWAGIAPTSPFQSFYAMSSAALCSWMAPQFTVYKNLLFWSKICMNKNFILWYISQCKCWQEAD